MKIEIDLLRTVFRVGLLLFFFNSFSQHHPLIKYYNGDLKLTEKQVDSLAKKTLEEDNSNYLKSLALYQKGVIQRRHGQDIESFNNYESSLDFLKESDTSDYYLHSSALLNQGAILHNYKLYEEAVARYQEALEPAYKFSFNQGVNMEYNIGLAMIQYDPKSALAWFFDLKEKVKDDYVRHARILNQIGLFYKRIEEYDEAISRYEEALDLGVSGRIKADLLQNISETYYQQSEYGRQEQYLLQVLESSEGNRFVALMDLGECLILQDRKKEALEVLLEAEVMYDAQPLKREHIYVYEWLKMVSDDPMYYADRQVQELLKYIDRMDQLKDMMKTLAMKNVLVAAETEQKRKSETAFLAILAILSGAVALAILLTWRIWWYRLRKSLGKKITAIVDRWEEEDRAIGTHRSTDH